MSAFNIDIGRQTTPPLVSGVVHNRLVQFPPHGDQTLAQLVDVLDSPVVHTLLITDQSEQSTGLRSGEFGGHMSGAIKSGVLRCSRSIVSRARCARAVSC